MCTAFLFLAAAASEAGGGGSVASTSGGDASASGGGRGSAAAAAASLSLLLAFSRDEYLQRSTAPLHAWADADVVGGRDLQRRGTWLGASRSGRVAFLTNRIAPGSPPFVTAPAAPSRGALVPSALASTDPPLDFLGRAMRDSPPHLGYNLVLADVGRREAAFASNADAGGGGPTLLSPGVHGIANVGLEEGGALPKVRRGTAALAQILEGAAAAAEEAEEEQEEEGEGAEERGAAAAAAAGPARVAVPWRALFERLLSDGATAAAHELQDDGREGAWPLEARVRCSALCIEPFELLPAQPYGTVSQTIVAAWTDGRVEMRERSRSAAPGGGGGGWELRREAFTMGDG